MTTLDIIDPSTLEPFDSVPLVPGDTVDGWLDEMTRLHRAKAALPAHERIAILDRAAALMTDRRDDLAALIAREGGKPLVDARVEADRAIAGVRLAVHELHALAGRQIPMDLTAAGAGRMAFTAHEPIGPVVAVSAFNHPLNLVVHHVAPAVATGCPVILKPADDTPLSARAFIDILYRAGLPPEWCRFAPTAIPVAEKMVTDPRTAFFSFIGSAKVGWMLRSKLAPGTRYALEHGGAAPVIVDAGTAPEDIVAPLLKGGFYHSGQVCVSVQRVFAPRAEARALADALAAGANALTVGDAKTEATDCGPLIRPREVDRVAEWVAAAGDKAVVTGGKRISEAFYTPTILFDPPPEADVSTKEIFGPVICVYPYDDADEAIARANALPFAFQAAVFTQRLDFAATAIAGLDASAVMVNDHTAFRIDAMPFAGRKQSGYGTGGIGYTMRDMTEEKMAVIRL
ncbi:MAG: aldehyde dehydrogenase family protein [Pseudomonadota bacterium]